MHPSAILTGAVPALLGDFEADAMCLSCMTSFCGPRDRMRLSVLGGILPTSAGRERNAARTDELTDLVERPQVRLNRTGRHVEQEHHVRQYAVELFGASAPEPLS